MTLKAVVESLDGVDSRYHDLYIERDGKWHLDTIEGLATQADLDRLSRAASQERDAHRATKDELNRFKGLGEFETLQTTMDRIPELEAAAEAGSNPEKVDQLVEAKIAGRLAPIERERDTALTRVGELESEVTGYKEADTRRQIHDAVRVAATESKMLPSAVEDALMHAERVFEINADGAVVTKDNVGVTPGIAAPVWLTELQDKRAHWWPGSSGGGADPGNGGGGRGGPNPFSHKDWNLTEQSKLVKEDRVKAEQMAKSAGTTIGGPRPAAPAA